jgi:hypothetical protein
MYTYEQFATVCVERECCSVVQFIINGAAAAPGAVPEDETPRTMMMTENGSAEHETTAWRQSFPA